MRRNPRLAKLFLYAIALPGLLVIPSMGRQTTGEEASSSLQFTTHAQTRKNSYSTLKSVEAADPNQAITTPARRPKETTVAPKISQQQGNDIQTADKFTSEALAYHQQGNYAVAETLLIRAQAIRERILGKNHPDTRNGLNDLAKVYYAQGEYTKARELFVQALAIAESAQTPDYGEIAAGLSNLGEVYRQQGQYAKAASILSRAISINDKAFGPDHPQTGVILNNLGLLYLSQGNHDQAEPLLTRALAITEKANPDSYYTISTLNNLASLHTIQGQYNQAQQLFSRALAATTKTYGPSHPDTAFILKNLGWIYQEQGQYSQAEQVLHRALKITEKTLGIDHPDAASILNGLAEILYFHGKYAEAESLVRQSLAILENILGSNHPAVAKSLNNLALLLGEQGEHSSALTLLDRHRKARTTWYLRELPLLPDRSRRAQMRTFEGLKHNATDYIYGLIASYPPAALHALETRLNRQGLLHDIEKRQALLINAPGVDRIKVDQLQAMTQQLASVTLPADRRAEVSKQWDQLQAEIYRQIPELELQPVTTAEVARALPADGALVEFQRYQPFEGRKPKGQRWGDAQYIALVLNPDARVASVPLGPAAAIDAAVNKGLNATADGLSDSDAIWAELSAKVLKPLLPHLTGSRQWFLSPDGELNRVPFAALPAPQQPGTRLAQIVQLRLLTTGRELVKLQQPTPTGSGSLVMANPTYDRLGAKPAQKSKPAEVTAVAQQRSAELGSNQWKQLPASEREGQKVAKLLGTGLISGSSATTKALQRHQGPRVLHVATHGFFVTDQETKPTEPMRAIQEGSPLLISLRQEDPMLRSGLVFAGANQPDLDPNDDGYLTAAEAVNLKLKGTELVVLSACSTGQGEVRTGEGVYGLQRSLTVAGARSTLLSLWKVDDAATAEFMGRFYQRLKAGEGRSDALAAVQEEFRSGEVQSTNGINWKEPYYWAAWQLVGDWRPIPGL